MRASVGTLSPRKAHLPEPSLLTAAPETEGRLGEPAASGRPGGLAAEHMPPPPTPSAVEAPRAMPPDAASNVSFFTLSTAPECLTAEYGQYSGAAAVGTSVYFSPAFDGLGAGHRPTPGGAVGVLHTPSGGFSSIDNIVRNMSREYAWFGGRGNREYRGAAAVGTRLFFAPHYQDNVGVIDTVTSAFSMISIGELQVQGDQTPADYVEMTGKYDGALAVGTTVYFTPCNKNNVGVLDTVTDTFRTVSTLPAGVRGEGKYRGAAAVGGLLEPTPYPYPYP